VLGAERVAWLPQDKDAVVQQLQQLNSSLQAQLGELQSKLAAAAAPPSPQRAPRPAAGRTR
jgi:hypothetical protein